MALSRQSQIFDINKIFWNIFGIWPGKVPMKYYKFYSLMYITITTVTYNILLTLNLFYTPRNLEAMIREVVFFFTEVAVIGKVVMILVMREKIIAILKLMDCKEFQGEDTKGKEILNKTSSTYTIFWKAMAFVSNFSYFSFIVLPILLHFIWKADIELPICKYYFLSDDVKEKYFWTWYMYQSFGIYGHMTYNINVDSFIAGLMWVAIGQLKMLNHNFSQLAHNHNSVLVDSDSTKTLNKLLRHYDIILR